jgi:hypothetical protein
MLVVGHVEGRQVVRFSDVVTRGGGGATQRHGLSTCLPCTGRGSGVLPHPVSEPPVMPSPALRLSHFASCYQDSQQVPPQSLTHCHLSLYQAPPLLYSRPTNGPIFLTYPLDYDASALSTTPKTLARRNKKQLKEVGERNSLNSRTGSTFPFCGPSGRQRSARVPTFSHLFDCQ